MCITLLFCFLSDVSIRSTSVGMTWRGSVRKRNVCGIPVMIISDSVYLLQLRREEKGSHVSLIRYEGTGHEEVKFVHIRRPVFRQNQLNSFPTRRECLI